MILSSNCAPTLIFIGFSLIQILVDLYKGVINQAFIKFIVMIVFSVIINILCDLGLKVIAWFIVLIPIIMMTLISTLLLKVFGTNPDEKDLRSKLLLKDRDISNNFVTKDGRFYLDNSGNYLTGNNLLNQQKYAYFYDRFNAVERIDRNPKRRNFYDNVEDVYDLNSPVEDMYDLSNNPIKYRIVDYLINSFGENYFTNSIISYFNINYHYPSYINNTNRNRRLRLNNNINDINDINDDINDESYERRYNDRYLADGQILFRRNRYKRTKDENPNLSDIHIYRIIDDEWNDLTAAQQHRWNNNSGDGNSEDEMSYDPDDLSSYGNNLIPIYENSTSKYSNNGPCPVNETKQSFKQKTGLDCYDVCPPGKQRNSVGNCVLPCPSGEERLNANGSCQPI